MIQMGVSVTQSAQAGILFVGNDPSLEYLLKRYARRSGYQVRVLTTTAPELDVRAPRPASVWFSSFDVLEASPGLRAALASHDIPAVVCSPVADEARALELGADYVFLHPVTYDCFLSVAAGKTPEKGVDT
jgi:CheY-like chemotaxis protein